MQRAKVFFLMILLAVLLIASPQTSALDQSNKGLLITPLRGYVSITPGGDKTDSLSVANLTPHSIPVSLSVEQFSVANYTYDYQFSSPKEDWVKLQTTQTTLASGSSQKIGYTIRVPKNATPGGHYFTVFASTTLDGNKQVRVATVLYVTVGGDLVRTNTVSNESIAPVVVAGDIPYAFDVKNTGNTHYFVYVSGKLNGLSAAPVSTQVTHILLPATTRSITGSIPAPQLPGVYRAVYGYQTEDGQHVERSGYVVYAPLWFLLTTIGLATFAIGMLKRRHRLRVRRARTY